MTNQTGEGNSPGMNAGPDPGYGETADFRLRLLQGAVDALIRRFPEGYWPPLSNLARLTEETGELARAVNLRAGAKRRKPSDPSEDIALEMGDVLFTLCILANQFSVDLDDAMAKTLDKVTQRDLHPL